MDLEPTVILADTELDLNKLIFQGVDTTQCPLFSLNETASFFFAKKKLWLANHDRDKHLVFDGKMITGGRENNMRFYNLSEIEKIAHGLAANQYIPGERLRITLQLLRWQGRLWMLL
jgi:hypothetical protein